MRDALDPLPAELGSDAPIELDDVVSIGDDEYLAYGTAGTGARDAAKALVDALPHWESVSFRSSPNGAPKPFELHLVDPPLVSTITALGGSLDDVLIEDGDFRTTVHLSPSADVRRVIERVESTYAGAEMLRCVQVQRDDEAVSATGRQVRDALTDRQRSALEAAYHSGYFEWPREADGETVAASLGVAPPTFHQHLRKAERAVLDAIIGADGVGVDPE